jgi:hypothetical protein
MSESELFMALNGQRIVSGQVMVPYYGCWTGDVTLALPTSIPNNCTLQIGNLTLTGFAYRMSSFAGSRTVRLVGGYGGWRLPVPFQEYYNAGGVSLSTVLKDAANTVGEQINIPTDVNLGSYFIRENAPAQRLLRLLAGPEWFVDPNGVTQIGQRTIQNITSAFLINHWNGGQGSFEVSTEDYASWLPGRFFSNELVLSPQIISMTTFEADNDGKLRLKVLSAGAQDLN